MHFAIVFFSIRSFPKNFLLTHISSFMYLFAYDYCSEYGIPINIYGLFLFLKYNPSKFYYIFGVVGLNLQE